MKVPTVIVCALLVIGVSETAKGQEWRRIVPLHSTCEDAKRILNFTRCEPSTLDLEDVRIIINFSTGPCTSAWNVAAGTILTLDVHPKTHLTLSDLQIDETKYSKERNLHLPNTLRLDNSADGISIDLFEDGSIRYIFYGPSSRDEHLRCGSLSAQQSRAGNTGSVKIDQYAFIPFEEERARLTSSP